MQYRAPGRVNLIGEHTDYNQGYVMPIAIDLACQLAVGPRPDRKLVIYSENVDKTAEANLDNIGQWRRSGKWCDYPLGVAALLEQAGYHLEGANLYVYSEVPLGAGLSSSAAVEVSVGYALLKTNGHEVDLTRLALLCQRAENEFVGARCGIMDQFIACHGRAGNALMLDCRSLSYQLDLLPENIHLVICNTMVKHELAGCEYNTRRSQCEEAVQLLSRVLPQIRALRDVTLQELEQYRGRFNPTIYKRARHIISENQRVLWAASALQACDIVKVGRLMQESHRSLRDDYEVSCRELDVMVGIANSQENVYGARMTGGGFGGCTVNLVVGGHAADFKYHVAREYHSQTGYEPQIWICKASQGVEELRSGDQGRL